MNKFSKILVALLAATALATPAFAITADFTGFYQARGIAYDNVLDGDDDAEDNARGVDSRYRLWTNTALNENVKAVFAIEVDYAWGKSPYGKRGAGDLGAIGADTTGAIEIKNLYLDFNIPTANVNVKAGTQYLVLANNLLLGGDDTTGLNARWTPAQGQSVIFAWVKTVEDEKTNDTLDQDYYHLQYDTEMAGWKLAPFIGYYDMMESDRAIFLGVTASGKAGPVALTATLIGNDWDIADTDGNGFSALVNGKFSLGAATTLIAEVGYAGDSDAANGEFVRVKSYNPFSEIVAGGRFDNRGTIATGTTYNTPNNNGYSANYQYLKLGAEQKVSDSIKLSGYYVFAEQAEDVSATKDAITYGHEVNAYADFAVVKGLTYTLAGAYLLADDDFGAGDNAWKLGTALTYSF